MSLTKIAMKYYGLNEDEVTQAHLDALADLSEELTIEREKEARRNLRGLPLDPEREKAPLSRASATEGARDGDGFYRRGFYEGDGDLHAKTMMTLDSRDEGGALGDFQRLNDDILWTASLLNCDPRETRLHRRHWRENVSLQKALSTTDTDWIK